MKQILVFLLLLPKSLKLLLFFLQSIFSPLIRLGQLNWSVRKSSDSTLCHLRFTSEPIWVFTCYFIFHFYNFHLIHSYTFYFFAAIFYFFICFNSWLLVEAFLWQLPQNPHQVIPAPDHLSVDCLFSFIVWFFCFLEYEWFFLYPEYFWHYVMCLFILLIFVVEQAIHLLRYSRGVGGCIVQLLSGSQSHQGVGKWRTDSYHVVAAGGGGGLVISTHWPCWRHDMGPWGRESGRSR